MPTPFFIWRGCNISGSSAQTVVARNSDILERGKAFLGNGVPEDAGTSDELAPELDIVSAVWGEPQDGGDLEGTHEYRLIPLDTCTGRTGVPVSLPPLTLGAGQKATLRATFSERPNPCLSALLQRDGELVGHVLPVEVTDNVPVVTTPNLTGTFTAGTKEGFTRASGADLVVGDTVSYQGKVVSVKTVVGNDITIDPPIPDETAAPPAGMYDVTKRVGIYVTDLNPIFFFGLPFVQPLQAFKYVPTGLLADVVAGDLIVYGSKTALVIGTQLSILTPGFVEVAVIPFGLLPIPPLPVGTYFLVARPLAPFIGSPSVGLYSDLGFGAGPWDQVTVVGNGGTGAPTDANLTIGATVILNGRLVEITGVENATPINGPIGSDPTQARITFKPGFTRVEEVTNLPNGSGLVPGIYISGLPPIASLFLDQTSVPATGSYQRLSRVVEIQQESSVFQFTEDGTYKTKAGSLSTAVDARRTLHEAMAAASYPGGLDGLFERLRGKGRTTVSRTFNDTLGSLIRTTGGTRLFAVNDLANEGNGVSISIPAVREISSVLCGSFDNTSASVSAAVSDGVVVNRYSTRAVASTAACPPGQPVTTSVELVCEGQATINEPAQVGDVLRVFFAPDGRSRANMQAKLVKLGLTSAEASAALDLRTEGRVDSAVELESNQVADILDLGGLGTPSQIDEILEDVRIETVNSGKLTRAQINNLLRKRGSGGVAKRIPGTLARTTIPPVDDFALLAHRIASLSFQYQESFDLCDFDGMLASIEDESTRAAVAGVFSVVESSLEGLVTAGTELEKWLSDATDGIDAVGGILTAISADPTLGCLLGPVQQDAFGVPTIPALETYLQGFAFPFTVRFQLSELFAEAIRTILCSLLNALLKLLPSDAAAATQRAVGCLPSLEDLALAGFTFPSLDVQIALECSLDKVQMLSDIISELIAEANEVINLINSLGSAFVFRSVEARNTVCSGREDFDDLIGQALRGLGLDQIVASLAQVQ